MESHKKTVLLVDDNKDFGQLFQTYLERLGHETLELVGVCYNGLDALNDIEMKQPDIVILDVVMPMLDGLTVLNKMSAMKLAKRPKVLMLSAVGECKKIRRAFEMGAVAYFEKPFDIRLLVSRMNQL